MNELVMKAAAVKAECDAKVQACIDEISQALGTTVISVEKNRVHVFDENWTAAHDGAEWIERDSDIYPWHVRWENDGVVYFSVATDAAHRRYCGGDDDDAM